MKKVCSYCSPEFVVAQAVEIEIRGGEEYFRHIADDDKLLEDLRIGTDVECLHRADECHRNIGHEEDNAHNKQEFYKASVLLGDKKKCILWFFISTVLGFAFILAKSRL